MTYFESTKKKKSFYVTKKEIFVKLTFNYTYHKKTSFSVLVIVNFKTIF